MNRASYVASQLKEIAGDDLLQESPYPILAPRSSDLLPRIIGIAKAEGFRILCHGTGSSFPKDFTLLQDNILAITTYRLRGVFPVTPFINRVLAGTPVEEVFSELPSTDRKTIGGLIASSHSAELGEPFGSLWSKVMHLEVLTGSGSIRHFAGPSQVNPDDPGVASWFPGSNGKLGMIVALHVASAIPVPRETIPRESLVQSEESFHRSILKREEIEALLDPEGVFKW